MVITKLFADVVASWLLFDNGKHVDHRLVAPPTTMIVAKSATPTLFLRREDILGGGAASSLVLSPSSVSASCASENMWTLPNGRVQFSCPLTFAGISIQHDGEITSDSSLSSSSSISLWDPKFLGRYGESRLRGVLYCY